MVILAYHKVDNRFELGLTNVKPKMFDRHISALKGGGFEFLTTPEDLATNRRSVHLTFDDGYDCFYRNVVPILFSAGVRAEVFVISDYIGKENTWDVRLSYKPFMHMNGAQLREIAAMGFKVGSHSCSHKDLTRLDRNSLWNELRNSKAEIEDLLGREVKSISFPFGKSNSTVTDIAREAGYMELYGLGRANSPGVIGRVGVYRIDTPGSVKRKADGNKYEILKSDFIHSFAEISALSSVRHKRERA